MIQRQGKKIKGGEKRNPEKLDALISMGRNWGQSVLPFVLSINGQEVQSFFPRERELIHIPSNLKCLF